MKFTIRLTQAKILAAIKQYVADSSEMEREHKAFASGDLIAAGNFHSDHLDPIIDWKSSRPKSQIKSNDPGDLYEALSLVTTVRQERTAMAVLCGLHGIRVRMASAILTAINRQHFTVIDWRTLAALGVSSKQKDPSINDYLKYLEFCRSKAKEHRISLRDLDRALWIVGGR